MIIKCLASGDFDFTSNGMAFTQLDANENDTQEILQLLRNYLLWFQGEEPTEITGGVPYFQQIFDKKTPQDVVIGILRAQIENVPGVLSVTSLTYTLSDQRALTVNFTVQSIAGPVTSTIDLMPGFPPLEPTQ